MAACLGLQDSSRTRRRSPEQAGAGSYSWKKMEMLGRQQAVHPVPILSSLLPRLS